MNRGLTGVIDAGQYTQALNIINNSTARVAALQSAPESCAAYLDFQCDANDNVATTVQRLDTYMKAAFYRLQTLMASSGGNRNGLSLIQTMIRIVKTTALTQAERDDFSESAGNFTEGANATNLAQSTYAQEIADLLAALIDKNAEAAEAESAPVSSNACAAVAKAFERVERLLHKAGTALTVGSGARRLDTSMFESWSSPVDATGRGQLQPSGATLGLPQFSYQANSAATAGDIVVMVALRWKNRVDLCRTSSDLTLVSDIHTVSALGDASRMGDDVYFATGETMDMTFTARTSSSRAAQRTTGCSGPKECRWWNTATKAWDPSGCTYSETTESCSCSHLTDFAVVTPSIECEESDGATGSAASALIFALIPIIVVLIGVGIYYAYRRRSRSSSKVAALGRSKTALELMSPTTPKAFEESEVDAKRDTASSAGPDIEAGDGDIAERSISIARSPESEVGPASEVGQEPGSPLPGALMFNESTPGQLVVDSSSDSEGVSHLESHVLPDSKQLDKPQDETPSGRGAETLQADDPNVPSEAGPAEAPETAESQAAMIFNKYNIRATEPTPVIDSSSDSEGVSHLESHVLPDTKQLDQPQDETPSGRGAETSQAEDPDVPSEAGSAEAPDTAEPKDAMMYNEYNIGATESTPVMVYESSSSDDTSEAESQDVQNFMDNVDI